MPSIPDKIPATTPVASSRIEVIDAIRGFAVMGILLANIQSWSGYKFLPYEYIEQLPYYPWDHFFNLLNDWFVDGRFYSIFSLLFGVGFGIQYLKWRDNLAPFISKYQRRLSFLLLFGILHSLLWSGDILTLYALMAFVLVALRNLTDRGVLTLAIATLGFFLIPQTLVMILIEPVAKAAGIAPKVYPDVTPDVLNHALGQGSLLEVFQMNLHNLYWRWLDFLPNGRISRVLGLFLLGFWLARVDYFRSTVFRGRQILIFGIPGLALTYLGQCLHGNLSAWSTTPLDILTKAMMVGAQVFLALAYISIIAWLFKQPWGERLLYPLTQIGRTAFTSYLAQSVIGIAIFYGIGFGLYGSLGLAQLWLLTLLIFAAQVVAVTLWLRYFKQGPVEWLWRSLTEKRILPNRRAQ